MNTLFKRHQMVKIKRVPLASDVEWYADEQPLMKNMTGKINILLSNGSYHVELHDAKGIVLGYMICSEDDLEAMG